MKQISQFFNRNRNLVYGIFASGYTNLGIPSWTNSTSPILNASGRHWWTNFERHKSKFESTFSNRLRTIFYPVWQFWIFGKYFDCLINLVPFIVSKLDDAFSCCRLCWSLSQWNDQCQIETYLSYFLLMYTYWRYLVLVETSVSSYILGSSRLCVFQASRLSKIFRTRYDRSKIIIKSMIINPFFIAKSIISNQSSISLSFSSFQLISNLSL